MKRIYELIHEKRDGGELSPADITAFAEGVADGSIPDYQAAAFLMAVFFQGMSNAELSALTAAMIDSGDVIDLSSIPGTKVDKHSTGGVGDKISIPLAPLVAACGVPVPMISGRGLGHTGGTLDKLESIPGFRTGLSADEFRHVLGEVGTCMAAATADLAPADRTLYALRDATATVESVPLIASSILSKKIAEGIDALVLDVKVGAGAFMPDLPRARELARTLLSLGRGLGKTCVAHLTAMDAPLGRAVGNALEVAESIAVLRGEGPADVMELTVELGAEMLVLGSAAPSHEAARERIRQAIADGSGLARLRQLVEAQGGDVRTIDEPELLPRSAQRVEVLATRTGFVASLNALEVGLAAVQLGAGRARKEDAIDPAVGFVLERRPGDPVRAGDVLAVAHMGPSSDQAAVDRLLRAYRIEDAAPAPTPLLLERMS